MLDKMKSLLKQSDLCVLATCRDNKPHCSLMTYITDDEGLTIYMITNEQTVKWANVTANPRISLLIDTRTTVSAQAGSNLMALTVEGTVVRQENKEERRRVIERIVSRKPRLGELAADERAVPLVVRAHSFLLLDGILESYYEEV